MYYCKNCGLLLPADAAACPRCGAPRVEVPRQAAPQPSAPRYTFDDDEPSAAPAPMSTAATLGWMLLFSIPVAGLVAALVCAFLPSVSAGCRTLARAWLLRLLIVAAVILVLVIVAGAGLIAALAALNAPVYSAF